MLIDSEGLPKDVGGNENRPVNAGVHFIIAYL